VELRSLVPLPLLFFTKDSGASFCERDNKLGLANRL